MKKKLLFLCTGNSCRSQMAEGLLRHWAGDRFEVVSAGTAPQTVHPLAVKIMGEIGVDISGHSSKSVKQFLDREFDYIITVCDRANETCPLFPGRAKRIHWNLNDPARAEGNEAEKLKVFRQVREDLISRIEAFLSSR